MRTLDTARALARPPLLVIAAAAGVCACGPGGGDASLEYELPAISDAAVSAAVEQAVAELESRPDEAAAHYELAVVYDANGLYVPAARTYERALELDPEHARAWYHLARARFELGQFDAALAAIERAGELDTDYAPARWRRGQWLLEAGRTDEARAAFESARAASSRDPGALLGLARLELRDERHELAAQHAEAVLADFPDTRYAHFALGSALQALGDTDGAQRAFARADSAAALEHDPWVNELLTHRVGLQVEKTRASNSVAQGETERGLATIRSLLRERPGDLGLIAALLEGLAQRGEHTEAARIAQATIEEQPEHPRAHLLAGRSRELAGDLPQALAHTRRAVALHADFATGHAQLGRLQLAANEREAALASYTRALELGFSSAGLLLDLGVLQRMAGLELEAVATFERATSTHPDLFEAQLYLARARGEVGQLEAAREALEQARALAPEHRQLPGVEARLLDLERQAGIR